MRRRHVELCAALAAVLPACMAAACFTTPPPDLPAEGTQRPTILTPSVEPPSDLTLTELPAGGFLVPVDVADGEFFYWDVYVDYDPVANPNPLPRLSPTLVDPSVADGGVSLVPFALSDGDFEPWVCPHRIEFFVAHQFNEASPRSPQSFGGDSVSWFYEPDGCTLTYDAGDGAFPSDAEGDGLPGASEAGTDP